MTEQPRFDFTVIASALHDHDTVATLTAGYRRLLEELGGVRTEQPGERPELVLVATGGTERPILDHLTGRTGSGLVQLVAHPLHNSLPAALEATARLHQDGIPARIVYVGDPASAADRRRVAAAVDDVVARQRLEAATIGLVGTPSDWLVASTHAAEVVARRFGPRLVDVDMASVIGHYRSADRSRSEAVAVQIGRHPAPAGAHRHEPDEQSVRDAAQVVTALEQAIEHHDLDAVTVRCFDFLGELHTSGCIALAELNRRAVTAGCEGDIPSTLAMLWVRVLLDEASWVANPAQLDLDTNHLLLAHCTIDPTLVTSYDLSTHFESGIGVGIHGTLAAEEVTLIRLGGADLERRWLAEGRVVAPGGNSPDLCRTQVTVELDRGRVQDLLTDPLGNHLVLVPGRHADRLDAWWNLFVAGRTP